MRTHVGRLLAITSVVCGLVVSAYIVNAVFETLNMSRSERYIIERLELKGLRVEMVEAATLLIQRTHRARRWRRRMYAAKSAEPETRRELRRQLSGVNVVSEKRLTAISEKHLTAWEHFTINAMLAVSQARFEAALATWRRARQVVKKIRQRDFEVESMMEKILGHTSLIVSNKLDAKLDSVDERLACVDAKFDNLQRQLGAVLAALNVDAPSVRSVSETNRRSADDDDITNAVHPAPPASPDQPSQTAVLAVGLPGRDTTFEAIARVPER